MAQKTEELGKLPAIECIHGDPALIEELHVCYILVIVV